jgi:hypothetical protein
VCAILHLILSIWKKKIIDSFFAGNADSFSNSLITDSAVSLYYKRTNFFIIDSLCTNYYNHCLDSLTNLTDLTKLYYDTSTITIRVCSVNELFPGMEKNPEADYVTHTCAYIYQDDSLQIFRVLNYELVILFKDQDSIIKEIYRANGARLSEEMKMRVEFLYERKILRSVYLQNIFIKDKKGNYLKMKGPKILSPK